jgi:hypothetical protein
VSSALAEWRVLSGGIDEVDLWQLPGVHTFYGFPGIPRTSPEVELGDVQVALADALQRGLVLLYDETSRRELDPDEASVVAADRAYFDRDETPRTISILITEAGEKAAQAAWDRYRAEAGL